MFTDIYVDLYKQALVENMRETSTSTVMTSYYPPPPIFFLPNLAKPKSSVICFYNKPFIKKNFHSCI